MLQAQIWKTVLSGLFSALYVMFLFMLLQAKIHDYMEKMLSIDHAFNDRSNALHHVQSLSADLYSLHNRAGRLAAPPKDMKHEWSNFQKSDGLKETIKSTEAAKIYALKDYENIKVNRLKNILYMHPGK
jgi:hypothetical protein